MKVVWPQVSGYKKVLSVEDRSVHALYLFVNREEDVVSY
jgi:hypothetical protein